MSTDDASKRGHIPREDSIPHNPGSVILPELQFRRRPLGIAVGSHRVTVSRWTSPNVAYPLELSADAASLDDAHILTYALRPTDAELTFYGREFLNGRVGSQHLLITGPYQPIRSIQRRPFDGIRIYLPQSLFAECFETAENRAPSAEIVVSDPKIMMDPMIETMMQMVFSADARGGEFVPSFIEGMSIAIASRLLQLDTDRRVAVPRSHERLATWRLRRIVEYIDANIGRPISLHELGSIAGLSRMRFAAQFRATTGYSPHEFILRRKILKAQQLLSDPTISLVGIALMLGFRTQAHFTYVFRKIVGDSPGRWRRSFSS